MSREDKKPFIFPVSTLIGSGYKNYRKVLRSHYFDRKYRKRYVLTTLGSMILSLLAVIEKTTAGRKIDSTGINAPPIFIIGYWRSGTTLLHTMLCTDPKAAYVDTFQGIFPNHVFLHKMWISFLARLIMPSKRPVDGVKLELNYPQEEEIAMGNMQPLSFYHFFYFPKDTDAIKRRSLLFEGVSEKEAGTWEVNYRRLIKSAILNTGGKQFISKNPPNTFRIPRLLRMFPEAKFIFLHRDPVYVLSSFKKFATRVAEGIGLQEITEEEFERPLCELYGDMMVRYRRDRKLIPPGNLLEIGYKDLMADPLGTVDMIYEQFGMGTPDHEPMKALLREKPAGSTSNYDIPETIRKFVHEELPETLDRQEQ